MSALTIVVSASMNSSWGSKDKQHYVDGYDEGYKIGLINGYDKGYDIGIKGIEYTGTGLIGSAPKSTTSQDIGYADGYTVGYNLKFLSGYNVGIKIYEQKSTPTTTSNQTTTTPTTTSNQTTTTPTTTSNQTTTTPTITSNQTTTTSTTTSNQTTTTSTTTSNQTTTTPIITSNQTTTTPIITSNQTTNNTDTTKLIQSQSSSSSSSSDMRSSFSKEPAKNVASVELATRNIMSGNHIRYDFLQNSTCIMYIEYDAKRTFQKTTTTVEELKSKSNFVPERASGSVYKYVNIWVGDNGGGLPTSLANGVIGFRVEKSWIKNNSVNESLITLQWYNQSWEPLYTKKVGEDNNYSYFTSKAPGFSCFAITYSGEANKNNTQIEAKLHDTTESLVGAGNALNKSENNSKAEEVQGVAEVLMTIALPLFLILVGYLVLKKKI
jgi:clumping factor A